MVDFLVAMIIIVAMGSACLYIHRKKKAGVKCIGCPSGETCAKCNCKDK